MARRRNNILDELFEALRSLFTVIHPAWCIPLAAIWFFAIRAWFNYKLTLPGLEPIGYLVAGLPALVSLIAGAAGWRMRQQRAAFLNQNLSIDRLNALTWREFEQQVAGLYRQEGYWVDELGGSGPDGGVDLRLSRDGLITVVQCKRWKTYKVGVEPVRALFGVMAAEKADKAVFITSGIYTQEALRFADRKPIALVDGAQLVEMMRRCQDTHVPARTGRPSPAPSEIPARPTCPRCGSEMVLRRAKTGSNAGREFWGCSTYPKCRGIREV